MSAPSPSLPDHDTERSRFLFVVARNRADLLPTLRRQFQDDRRVEVLLDRRAHDRRSQPAPIGVPERRHQAERRRPRDYWEDTAHHPTVLIPVAPSVIAHEPAPAPAVGPAGPGPGAERPALHPALDEARLLAWVLEGQRVVQQMLPVLLQQRASLVSQLHDATRRTEELARDNETLRAELARVTAAHRQLAAGHADVVDSVGQFLAQLIEVLEPVRVLADKRSGERPPAAV